MTTAEKIKAIRKEHAMTQAAFAKSLGIATVTVSHYETGRGEPSRKVAEAILEKYEKDIFADRDFETKKRRGRGARKRDYACEGLETAPWKVQVAIQSAAGGTISLGEVLAKVMTAEPKAEKIYIKPEENRAYYTGEEVEGSVLLWS